MINLYYLYEKIRHAASRRPDENDVRTLLPSGIITSFRSAFMSSLPVCS